MRHWARKGGTGAFGVQPTPAVLGKKMKLQNEMPVTLKDVTGRGGTRFEASVPDPAHQDGILSASGRTDEEAASALLSVMKDWEEVGPVALEERDFDLAPSGAVWVLLPEHPGLFGIIIMPDDEKVKVDVGDHEVVYVGACGCLSVWSVCSDQPASPAHPTVWWECDPHEAVGENHATEVVWSGRIGSIRTV